MQQQWIEPNLSLIVSALAAGVLLLIEWRWPNRREPLDPLWIARAMSLLIVGMVLTALLGDGFAASMESVRLFPGLAMVLAPMPAWLAGLIGYVAVTFFVYWWHRARHAYGLLWRVFHQVHHSPHRIEVVTAFYAHPADFLANALIVNAVAYSLLGMLPSAAVWTAIWVGVFELWEHTNIRTPRWLGYLIVRPEMHRIHHELERHTNNFGLPIWDMLFGTYENSLRQVECGFAPAREARLAAMLACRDVHTEARGRASAGMPQG